MKIYNKKNTVTRKKTLMLLLIILLLAGLSGVWYYLDQKKNSLLGKPGEPGYTVPSQNTANKSNLSDGINYNPATSEQAMPADKSAKSATNISPKPDLSISFSSVEVSGDILRIRTLITPLVGAEATCKMILSRSGFNTVTRHSNTQSLASSSTCRGFDEPTRFLEKGPWSVTVQVTNGQTVASTTREVSI